MYAPLSSPVTNLSRKIEEDITFETPWPTVWTILSSPHQLKGMLALNSKTLDPKSQ